TSRLRMRCPANVKAPIGVPSPVPTRLAESRGGLVGITRVFERTGSSLVVTVNETKFWPVFWVRPGPVRPKRASVVTAQLRTRLWWLIFVPSRTLRSWWYGTWRTGCRAADCSPSGFVQHGRTCGYYPLGDNCRSQLRIAQAARGPARAHG